MYAQITFEDAVLLIKAKVSELSLDPTSDEVDEISQLVGTLAYELKESEKEAKNASV